MDTQDDMAPEKPEARETTTTGGATRPLTVNISEDLLRKLRVVAVLKDESMSSLVEGYLAGQVRRDLKRLMGKLGE
jgi:hypothetical protein